MSNIIQNAFSNRSEIIEQVQLDGFAKIATATTMAQTLAYSLERKYLQSIGETNEGLCSLNTFGWKPDNSFHGFHWLKIVQVGKLLPQSKKNCFEAMQTILHSCHMPDASLAFLILGDDKYYSLYMGCRDRHRLKALQNFTSSNWAGVVSEKANDDQSLQSFFSSDKYDTCYALTGVPTLNANDQYAKNIDQIIGGCSHHKSFAYLVTARPVPEESVDSILRECRELQSQAESFKGFSISESFQRTETHSESQSIAKTITENITEPTDNGKGKKIRNTVLAIAGLTVAVSLLYPPALAIVPKAANKIQKIPKLSSALSCLGNGSSIQTLAIAGSMMTRSPEKRKDKSSSEATTDTTTNSFSDSYTKSISQNITNTHVEASIEHLKKHAERFELAKAIGMWEVGCYVFTDNDDNGVAASQIKAVLSGAESIYEPMRMHNISPLLVNDKNIIKGFKETAQIYASYNENDYDREPFRHPFGKDFARLTTFMTTKELSCLANFPTHSVPGVSVVGVWPEFSLSPQSMIEGQSLLPLGNLIINRQESTVPIGIDIDILNRHSLIAGVNGSGKTNTVLKILDGFLSKRRPIMIFEPAKTEYVDWAIKYNRYVREYNRGIENPEAHIKPIKIFMPGCSYFAKGNEEITDILQINPFEVIPSKHKGTGYRIFSHIDRLKSVLAGAFPMQEILPTVIERLLYKLYGDKGLLDVSKHPESFPTLSDINLPFIKELMVQLGYAEENTLNIAAALRTRFNSMKQGWKNDMLNNKKLEGQTWDELFNSPCIINLSYVGDDSDKAFIISLLMQFLYEYRIAEAEDDGYEFNDNYCRHLAIIEEAHRVMNRCTDPELPQFRSNQMFSSILSEVRAYGQGIMVVDQVPSRLIEDAVKNTNVKIIHKIVAADDAKMLAESVGLTPEQQMVIPQLAIGQGILVGLNSLDINSEGSADIYLAKIEKKK